MLEGKALVIAIMMLTAAPIAATDSGQIFIGDVRDNFEDMLANDEPTKVSEIIDDSKLDEKDLLSTEDSDIPCFTFDEWKDQYTPEEKIDDERDESEENDRAQSKDDSKDDEKTDDNKEDYYDRKDWADKKEFAKNGDCLTSEEWTLKFESDKEESCFTFEDIKAKKWDEKTLHKSFFGRDKVWDREEKDWDDEWFEELGYLAEQCDEGDEEACDELLAIREEWANDDESEDETEEESEQDDDTPCNSPNCDNDDESEGETEEESERDDDEADDRDEDEDFRLYLEELSNACEEGDDEACLELREIMAEMAEERDEKDWDKEGKDWDEACLTMKEWKEVFEKDNNRNNKDFDMSEIIMSLSSMDEEDISEIKEALEMSDEEWDAMMVKLESRNMTEEDWDMIMEKMKVFWEDEKEDDRKERGPHRDAIVRELLAELKTACDEGNEEACEGLEVMLTELEERDECDDVRDDDEDESGEDETDEEESEDDDSDEGDSEE